MLWPLCSGSSSARALSTDRADYCIPPSRCGPLFQLCKTLFMDGVMDITVSQHCSRFTTESFHAVFVARHRSSTSSHPEASKACGASYELIHSKKLSSTSSHPEARYAYGASVGVIHKRICTAVPRTLKPDTPMVPLIESFPAEFVA